MLITFYIIQIIDTCRSIILTPKHYQMYSTIYTVCYCKSLSR